MDRPYALRISYQGKTYDIHNYNIPNFKDGIIELPTDELIELSKVDYITLYPETFEKILNGVDNTKKNKSNKTVEKTEE